MRSNHFGLPVHLEVSDLRLVNAVARWGSLTSAGAELNLTQSALSRRLSNLEARVGARLFSRTGKRMVPTPLGERLRESAQTVLPLVASVEADLEAAVDGRAAIIRLSTECHTCYHWLPPVLRTFQQRFPGVEARIVTEATRRPISALLRGQLDLAIVSTSVRDRRLIATPLFNDELVAVVPPGHPWVGRSYVTARDFADQHLITYVLSTADSTLFQEVLRPAGISPRRMSQILLTEAILELVRAGFGVTVLARWAVGRDLSSGTLHAVRVTERGLPRHWRAVTRRFKSPPAHLAAFVDALRSAPFTSDATRRVDYRPLTS